MHVFNKCIVGKPVVVLPDRPGGPLWHDHVYDTVRACMAWKPRRHYLAPGQPNPAASTHVLTPPRSDGRTAVAVPTPFPAGLTAAIQSSICARLGSQARPCRLGKVADTLNPRTGRRPARWCGQRACGCHD